MKRLILSVFSLLIVSISTVFAAIPDSEFAIGGITIGSSADEEKVSEYLQSRNTSFLLPDWREQQKKYSRFSCLKDRGMV